MLMSIIILIQFFPDPVFYYHANWACMKLKLNCPWAQHLAIGKLLSIKLSAYRKFNNNRLAGLLVVLIDLPYDIVGIKFLHWTWHDTDPNICKYSYVLLRSF